MKTTRGLTLIEVLAAVAIAAILAGLAVPGLKSFLARRAADAAVTTLVSDLRLARAEAIRRGLPVTLCSSANGKSCGAAGASWHLGWIIFDDHDGNHAVGGNDQVLRVQQAQGSLQSIASSADSITFRANGFATGSAAGLTITADATVNGGQRTLCVSRVGKARLLPIGGGNACL